MITASEPLVSDRMYFYGLPAFDVGNPEFVMLTLCLAKIPSLPILPSLRSLFLEDVRR